MRPELTVCGAPKGYDVTLMQSPDAPGSVITLRVECGQVLVETMPTPTLAPCVRVMAHNRLSERLSHEVSMDTASGQCLPVPEAPTSVALASGLIALAILARWHRA